MDHELRKRGTSRRMPETVDWLPLWTEASRARSNGRLADAVRLYAMALARDPSAGEPFVEAAELGLQLCDGLAGVEGLYAAHCNDMGLAEDACPARTVLDRFVRDTRSSIAGNLARALDHGPNEIGWQRQFADALERVGRADLALHY